MFLGITAVFSTTLSFGAQSPAQPMQKGMSVELAVTSNAAPMPDADNEDAWIITVAADGGLYLGVDPVTADGLAGEMKRRPRRREQKLYIKADAHAPFADVKTALAAARANFFEAPVLLTSQPAPAAAGTIVPPRGLEVLIAPSSTAEAIEVQLSGSGQTPPTLRVNSEAVSWPDLPGTLKRLLRSRSTKVVRVEANDGVPFAAIVHVIDAARAEGAVVALPSYHSI